jgi:hypothetical protein
LPRDLQPTLPQPPETRAEPTKRLPGRHRRRRAGLVAVLTLVGLGSGAVFAAPELVDGVPAPAGEPGIEIPDVTGDRLDLAEEELTGLGLDIDAEGGGVFGVLVPENWEVCATSPVGGEQTEPGATVRVAVERPGAC